MSSKYRYTYSVVAPSGRVIYAHDEDKGRASRLAAIASNNTGGYFKLRQHRHER